MKKQKLFSRFLVTLLIVCMCMSCLPTAFAFNESFVSETHDVFSRTTSTIAPGVTQDICYAYANDGNQMVYYVATADITRDDVDVYANYKDNQCETFGMQKLTEQMAAAQAKHSNPDDSDNYIENYNVVAGVNGDFYNMTTGRPTGAFVMEGAVVNTANNRPFFAILKDGTPVIGANNTDWNTYVDADGNSTVVEAVGGSQVLVKDGADVTASASGSYNTDRHSRTCVGITAEGEVVLMVLDGRQAPFSCGGSMHELAQIMLEAGCVSAINLDGGGSTTFAAKQEGEDQVTIVNRPSDGSERSVSSSLMIVSTAVPSNVFDRAVLKAENDYVTPGSTVKVSATGVSPAGTSAEIPADVTWQLEDNSFGTVENGVFTSNGTTGEAVVQMVYNGNVVGSTTIKVVVPDAIKFNSSVITVPYSKTVNLDINATYGLNKVALKEEDINFSFSDNAMGTVDGFKFTACEETSGVTSGTITATVAFDNSISCTADIAFGKGSEIVQDFENGIPESYGIITTYPQYGPMGSKKDANGNYYYNGQNECGRIYAVNAETGKVRNGTGAMAVECDYSQIYETGWHGLNLNGINFTADASAQAVGMWVYLPELEDIIATNVRAVGSTTSGTVVNAEFWNVGYASSLECDGWRYFTFDLSEVSEAVTFKCIQLYINDRDNSEYDYYFKNNSSVNGKFTYYIDDITVDYSSAVEDREVPVFDYVRASYGTLSDAVDLKGQTIDSNVVSVTAKAVDDTTKSNYTGLDVSTAKAYIDGVELASGFTCTDDGIMAIDDVKLADGVHTFKFEICDKMGNLSYIERNIDIAAGSDVPSVTFVPQNPNAEKVLIGSVQWFDLVVSDIDKVESIKTTINLNSVSNWELDNIIAASGFEASYTIDEVTNNATITIIRAEDTTAVCSLGDTVVASLPVRTWVSRLTEYEGYEASTPEKLWSRKIIWPMDIKISVESGAIAFVDGTTGSFSSDDYTVTTELYGNYAELNENGDYSNKTSWHVHTAEALEDKAATCTEDGYTGRTFCEECNSVVDWGTPIPATGHTYSFVDDILKCEDCKILYTGEYEGKTYVKGILAQGWIEDSYYIDGIALTGIQMVDDIYYNFGDDGICANKTKYTGFYEQEDGWYYVAAGSIAKGWMYIDGNYHYFDPDTGLAYYGKKYYIYSSSYKFDEKGKVLSGLWIERNGGTMYYYGPSCYQRTWAEIDGNTYYFDLDGYRKEGICSFVAGINGYTKWYEFSDEGVLIREFDENGLYEFNGELYYLKNGINQNGLFEVDGYYYYFQSSTYTAVSGRYWITTTNGLDFEQGFYDFDEETHRMIREEDKNGLIVESDGTHYYVDGEQVYAGLVKVDGSYYYINSTLKAVTGRYWVEKNNGLLPKGFYEFDENGKMIREEDKNGLIVESDGTHYYVDGEQVYAGLIKVDGSYYYINSTLKAVTGRYWVEKDNGLLPKGFYEFDENGKMILL